MEQHYLELLKQHRTLETERLLLRPHTLEDADAVQRIGSDPRALEHLIWEGLSTREEAITAITDFYFTCPACFAIVLKETGELIGNIDFRLISQHEKGSFGYLSHPDYWGNGYMTEALTAVLHLAFDVLKLNRMESNHFIDNLGSGRVMEKAGMYYEGTAVDDIKARGEFRTQRHYGVTRKRWLAERQ